MTDLQTERDEWLARREYRSPEVEQARFGADVPSADELDPVSYTPLRAHET